MFDSEGTFVQIVPEATGSPKPGLFPAHRFRPISDRTPLGTVTGASISDQSHDRKPPLGTVTGVMITDQSRNRKAPRSGLLCAVVPAKTYP